MSMKSQVTIECFLPELNGSDVKSEIEPERINGMNYSTAVFLINRDMRAMVCEYDPTNGDNLGSGTYHNASAKIDGKNRAVFKTLDKDIKKDDYVVVQTNTRHCMTVVKVVETDVNVDLDSPTEVKWIVMKVDRTQHEKILADERAAVEAIKRAEFNKRRQDMLNTVATDLDEVKSLPMYKNGDQKTESK